MRVTLPPQLSFRGTLKRAMPTARSLLTIGDLPGLTGQPLRRQGIRRRLMTMGSADSTTAGSALQDASLTLLNYLEASGVPPESAVDENVQAYQQAWNADPANTGDQLVVDGKYGPLTQGTLNAMTGGIAPAVNGGPAPVPAPPKPAPGTITPAATTGSHAGLILLLIAAGVGAWLLLRKKKGSVRHVHTGPSISVRSNPRRRARRRNPELIP